jgi:hypothetical protein
MAQFKGNFYIPPPLPFSSSSSTSKDLYKKIQRIFYSFFNIRIVQQATLLFNLQKEKKEIQEKEVSKMISLLSLWRTRKG